METFWSRDVTDMRVLACFEPKLHKNFLNYMKSFRAKLF